MSLTAVLDPVACCCGVPVARDNLHGQLVQPPGGPGVSKVPAQHHGTLPAVSAVAAAQQGQREHSTAQAKCS